MITRSEMTGAIKLLNAANLMDRKKHLKAMLLKEHTSKDVAKVLADVDSYPAWAERLDLDVIPTPDAPAVPKKK